MKRIYLYLTLLSMFLAWPAVAQECPPSGQKDALLQFLLDHKSNSTDADPACVNRAFASLSRDKSYTEALVNLLDFERSTKKDDSLISRSSQYPAIAALARLGAIPQLVKVIEESDSEVVRTNAAHALDLIYRACFKEAITLLEREATNPSTNSVQQERLRAAEKYITEHFGSRTCAAHSASQ